MKVVTKDLKVKRWLEAVPGTEYPTHSVHIEVHAVGEAAEIISRAVDDILSMQELPAPTTDEGVGS